MKSNEEITFSVELNWKLDQNTSWGSRLDHYAKIGSNYIHWGAIILDITVIGVIGAAVSAILARSVKRDFANLELAELDRKNKRNRASRDEPEEAGLTSGEKKPVTYDSVSWKKL